MNCKLALLTIVLISFYSCRKKEFKIENLNNNKIEKFGHGGMGIGNTYPMNSLESILACLNHKMDGTEFDLQMTKDSVLVLYHDEFLDSKTNFTGKINSYTWQEISNVFYSITPHLKYKLIRLEDLFEAVDPKKYKFSCDIKIYPEKYSLNYLKSFSNQIKKVTNSYNLSENIYVESQDTMFLNLLGSDFKRFFYPNNFEYGFEVCQKFNYVGITISNDKITENQVSLAHQNGFQIITWNTHSRKKNIEAIEKNVDVIETDKVNYLSKMID
jgi:glycerophosphoryl diester phosphodiesterase